MPAGTIIIWDTFTNLYIDSNVSAPLAFTIVLSVTGLLKSEPNMAVSEQLHSMEVHRIVKSEHTHHTEISNLVLISFSSINNLHIPKYLTCCSNSNSLIPSTPVLIVYIFD